MNDIIQEITVAAILAVAVGYAVRHLLHRRKVSKTDCDDSGCNSCPLNDNCSKK